MTAILMNISATSANYALSFLSMRNSNIGEIAEALICTIIIGVAIYVYSRLTSRGKWSFNISADHSEMSFSKKMRVTLSTNMVAFWLVASLVMTFACMRVIA